MVISNKYKRIDKVVGARWKLKETELHLIYFYHVLQFICYT